MVAASRLPLSLPFTISLSTPPPSSPGQVGVLLQDPAGSEAVTLSLRDDLLASAASGAVRVWDLEAAAAAAAAGAGTGGTGAGAGAGASGAALSACLQAGAFTVEERTGGAVPLAVLGTESAAGERAAAQPFCGGSSVSALALSADRTCVVGGATDGTVVAWHVL